MTGDAGVRYEIAEGGIATIVLDRPAKRNALDRETISGIGDALARAERDEAVRVILLRGEGPDFCAGADLSELERIAIGAGPEENVRAAEELGRLLLAIRRVGKPVIAAVHGHALAGGAGLATACDIVLASDDARFGYPEVKLGFVPAMVMGLLRRMLGEKAAFQLVALGDEIDAAEARRLGIVTGIVPAATFGADVAAYAARLSRRSPSALRLIKRLFYGIDGASIGDAIARGAEVNALARMTEDTRAGVRRFLERGGGDSA